MHYLNNEIQHYFKSSSFLLSIPCPRTLKTQTASDETILHRYTILLLIQTGIHFIIILKSDAA